MVTDVDQTHRQVLSALQGEQWSEPQKQQSETPTEPQPNSEPQQVASGKRRIGETVDAGNWEEMIREHYRLITDNVAKRYPAFQPEPEQLDTLARLWGQVASRRLGDLDIEYFFDIAAISYTASLLVGQYVDHKTGNSNSTRTIQTPEVNDNDEEKGDSKDSPERAANRGRRYPHLNE